MWVKNEENRKERNKKERKNRTRKGNWISQWKEVYHLNDRNGGKESETETWLVHSRITRDFFGSFRKRRNERRPFWKVECNEHKKSE